MKKKRLLSSVILALMIGVFLVPNGVEAATQCKYSWTSKLIGTDSNGATMTGEFILSTGDDEKRLTVATSPITSRPAEFANKNGIALNSNGSCPSISIYVKNTSGSFKIYKNKTNCINGALTIDSRCSSDLKGTKLSGNTSNSNANNSGIQFELSSSSNSECKYTRKIVNSATNDTLSARNITIKKKSNNKVSGNCTTAGGGSCTLSVDVPNKFYNNNTFTCPKYIYTRSKAVGKEGVNFNTTVYDTGGETDNNKSTTNENGEVVDSNGNSNNKTFNNNATLDGLNQKYDNCSQLIDMSEGKFGWLLQKILNYIKIAGPILVVLLSAVDFIKAMASSDENVFKKAQSRLTIRLIAALALFLVPSLVQLLLGLINGISNPTCGLK